MNTMNKQEKIEKMAQEWTDSADLDSLMEFFYYAQVEYLESLNDEQLKEIFEENDID